MRKNTRAVRWRERYSAERQDILERIMNLNPNVQARKTMSHLLVRKRMNKVPIPIEKHPNYNFIGLIIGPRGKTQKELEAKTGCKIAIRGKGSVKEGARGRRDGKVMEGDHEPLHVVITGDDQRAVDAATDMIEQMLVVIDDEKNVHKQQQLRELALLNGTLKEDEFCDVCGEKGHRSFECPKRFAKNNNRPLVKCAICGDTSHPTRDCTQKPALVDPSNPQEQQQIDSEYLSFMAELDGKKAEEPTAQPPSGMPRPVTTAATSSGHVAGSLPPPPFETLPPPPPPPSMAPVGHLPHRRSQWRCHRLLFQGTKVITAGSLRNNPHTVEDRLRIHTDNHRSNNNNSSHRKSDPAKKLVAGILPAITDTEARAKRVVDLIGGKSKECNSALFVIKEAFSFIYSFIIFPFLKLGDKETDCVLRVRRIESSHAMSLDFIQTQAGKSREPDIQIDW